MQENESQVTSRSAVTARPAQLFGLNGSEALPILVLPAGSGGELDWQ